MGSGVRDATTTCATAAPSGVTHGGSSIAPSSLRILRAWMLQQAPFALLLYLWGGWAFVVRGVAARVTAAVSGYWLISYFAHNHGEMHFRIDGVGMQGKNVRFTSLLTMGECWYNSHHAFPDSAKLGLYPGE